MKPPSSEVSPCDDPRSLLENCASPRCGSHDRARLSTVTSVFAAGWPLVRNRLSTITSCSPSRCLRSRSSFDARARIHTRVPPSSVLANVPRRSPRVFTTFRPLRSSGPRSPSRVRIRVRLSTLTAVSTPSAHSPRAREFVSRYDGIHCDPLSRTAAPHRSRSSRSCSSYDDHVRVSVPPCLRMISALGQRCPPSRGLNFRPCLGIQIDLHLSTLTIQKHFRAHARATCLHVSRSAFASSSHIFTHVFISRLATLSNTLTARVHIQRIVIEKVWRFRLRTRRPARAFEPSDQTSGFAGSTEIGRAHV